MPSLPGNLFAAGFPVLDVRADHAIAGVAIRERLAAAAAAVHVRQSTARGVRTCLLLSSMHTFGADRADVSNQLGDRAQALLGYVATIAFDARVRAAIAAGSGEGLYRAVSACLKEDLPSVAGSILQGLARGVVRQVASRAEPLAAQAISSLFRGLEDMIAGRPVSPINPTTGKRKNGNK